MSSWTHWQGDASEPDVYLPFGVKGEVKCYSKELLLERGVGKGADVVEVTFKSGKDGKGRKYVGGSHICESDSLELSEWDAIDAGSDEEWPFCYDRALADKEHPSQLAVHKEYPKQLAVRTPLLASNAHEQWSELADKCVVR